MSMEWDGLIGLVELAMLAAVLCSAAYASMTDIRHRRIPNGLILATLAVGAIGHLVLWANASDSLLGATYVGTVGLIGAYLLYRFGQLGAGDAKLLWVLALGLPPSLVSAPPTSIDFPVWALLFNSLCISGLYVLVQAGITRRLGRARIPWQRLRTRLLYSVACGGLLILLSTRASAFAGHWAEISVAAVAVSRPGEQLLGNVVGPAWRSACTGLLVLLAGSIAGVYFTVLVMAVTALIEVLMALAPSLVRPRDTVVELRAIEVGMVPGETLYQADLVSGSTGLGGVGRRRGPKGVLCREGRPITRRERENLVGHWEELVRRGESGVLRIEDGYAFAPFLLCAVFVTIVAGGSVLGLLYFVHV